MSKYEPLWMYFRNRMEEEITLGFSDIEKILGFPIDHSFLSYKNELADYGYDALKISVKQQKVVFRKKCNTISADLMD